MALDILDIILGKKKAQGEAASIMEQARQALSEATDAAEQATTANETAQAAMETAQTAAESADMSAELIETMKTDITAAAEQIVENSVHTIMNEDYMPTITDSIDETNTQLTSLISNVNTLSQVDPITTISVADSTTSNAKVRTQTTTSKGGVTNTSVVEKNYTEKGNNEDGSMTQKAITGVFDQLEEQIRNIPSGGGGSTNLGPENSGSVVSVGDDGNIEPSTITEDDIIRTQIAAGTYQNNDIVGLEIDYQNRTFTRLQGAKNLSAGTNFDRFNMYGGRKRCIVSEDGQIVRFLTSSDTISSVANKRIMVYQPAFYYLRTPLETAATSNGNKIVKEQILLSDTKIAGFTLHPAFHDAAGHEVKYILLPAFESAALRANGTVELDDAQDIDLENDKLISTVNVKPISGTTQEFSYAAAEKMGANNGEGWSITDFEFESLNQMLMIVEFGSLNLQDTFNKGLCEINDAGGNISSITGSTMSLLNTSGQALSTYNTRSVSYTEEGKCAISYRGMENPYGNIWRFIKGLYANGISSVSYKNTILPFKIATGSGWINGFGYDRNYDWMFLPVELNGAANSILPVGDYIYSPSSGITAAGLAGGLSSSRESCGAFYYAFNIARSGYHFRSDSARVMHVPTAGSSVETNNYNFWMNS